MQLGTTFNGSTYLKHKVYSNLLASLNSDGGHAVATTADQNTPSTSLSSLSQSLLLDSMYSSEKPDGTRLHAEVPPNQRTASITQDEILRFSMDVRCRLQLNGQVQKQLAAIMDSVVSGMLHLLCVDDEREEELVGLEADSTGHLLKSIKATQTEISASEGDISELCTQIAQLMTDINQHAGTLQRDLGDMLSHVPGELNARRLASHDLLAARIETALIKLSLMRARAERHLYDHKSDVPPHKTVSQYLVTAHRALDKQEAGMRAEERALDKQLQEYEQLLTFMSTGGGYRQVIEDWSRVKQETEECKKDLRRLGWTE